MDKSDLPQFAEVWATACEVAGKPASDLAIEMAFNVLARHPFEDVRRAVMTHLETSQFVPKPADINNLIAGDPNSRKLEAWAKVESAIRRIGSYQTVVFDDPAIMVAIETMGGWIKLCEISDDELPFRRNEFTKLYSVQPPNQWPQKLIGITEARNAGEHPDSVPEPLLIGKKETARLVYQKGGDRRLEVAALRIENNKEQQ
jgi:hypothetical protein